VVDQAWRRDIVRFVSNIPLSDFQPDSIPFGLYGPVPQCEPYSGFVCHGDELPYVFNTLTYAAGLMPDSLQKPVRNADLLLAQQMVSAWGQFAKTLTMPSGWRLYSGGGGQLYTWGGSTGGSMYGGMESGANCKALWYTVPPLSTGSARRARTLPAAARAPRHTER
jgi:hypothetical protein